MKIWEKMQKSTAGQSLETRSVEHQLKEEKNKNHTLNFQIAEKEREISRLTAELNKSQTSEKNLQSQNHALKQHCEKVKTEVDMLKSNLSYNAGELDRLVVEFKQSEAAFHSELKKSLHEFESERNSLQRKLSDLQQKNHEQNQQRNIIDKQLEEYRLKTEHISREKDAAIERITLHYNNQLHDLRSQQEQYNNTIQNLKSQIESNSNLIRKQKLEYKKQIIDLESKLNKNQKIIAEANRKYEQEKQTLEYHKNEQISSLQQTKQNLESEISKQQNSNSRSQQEIDRLKAQLVKNQRDIQKIQSEFEANARAREMEFKKTISAADCRIKELEIHRQQTVVQQIPEKTINEPKEAKTQKEKIKQKKDEIKSKILNKRVAQHVVKTSTKSNHVSFDGLTYLSLNPELARESKIKIEDAKQHYKYFGLKEGKQCKQNKLWLQTYCYSDFERKYQNFYLIKSKKEAPSIYLGAETLCNLYFNKLYKDFEFVGYWDRRITSLINVDLDLKNLLKQIDRHEDQFQILSLNTTSFRDKLFSEPHQGSYENPDVWLALIKIISKMQSLEIINSNIPNLDAKTLRIYCNAFLVKKQIFEDYVSNFLIPALNIIKTDPEISEICAANSLCMGSVDSKNLFPFSDFLKKSNINYYPISSVVLDRLINCYALIKNYKIGFIL